MIYTVHLADGTSKTVLSLKQLSRDEVREQVQRRDDYKHVETVTIDGETITKNRLEVNDD